MPPILGTVLAAVVYVLGTTAVMGVIPAAELTGSNAPFADAASRMWGGWTAPAVAAGAMISAFGALNGWILLQGRIPWAAARDGIFPAAPWPDVEARYAGLRSRLLERSGDRVSCC